MNTQTHSTRILATRLFDGVNEQQNVVLCIEQGRIVAIDNNLEQVDQRLDGLVVPGYVDLQVNGGGGHLFNDQPSLDALQEMMAAHAQFGTTGMMPTVITDNIDTMQQAADVVSQALQAKMPGILGIHFEGPHISSAKKGAHCESFIRPISEAEWQLFARKDLGHIMLTLAPEMVSTTDIKKLVALGVMVCIGHSNADFETSNQAVKAGARGFTHLYNAMSPLTGRAPGVTGSALLNDQTQCGLIVDGYHVSAASCQVALRAKPTGGIFLVTDAMPLVGTQATEFAFFDRKVTNHQGKLTSTTGELAGSNLDMASAVKNTHKWLKVSLPEAIRMASLYPLSFLQNAPLPIAPSKLIDVNKAANFVLLDADLQVCSTWIQGQQVYSKQ
ncbi:N-acetylglucosamine-6-phosphate deacetylase [Paraglaciecola aestuariivivens]